MGSISNLKRLPNFCYHCGLLSHALKDCPTSPVVAQTEEECLQYGAWLRGKPIRRYPKEQVKHGGGDNQEHRGGVIGVRLEKP